MANRFILNETSYHGSGSIKALSDEVKSRRLKKALSRMYELIKNNGD